MPDREYGGGDYNSGYGGGYSAPDNPRAGDTPGFGTGGGGSVGGGGGYGVDAGGGLARGDGGRNDWMDQGRGSNVTDNRPQSPVEQAAGVGPGGAVNAAGPSPTIPVGPSQFPEGFGLGLSLFTTPAPMAPSTLGVPTINLNLPNNPYGGAFIGQNVRNYMNPNVGIGTQFYGNTGQVSSGALGQSPQPTGFRQTLDPQVRQDYLNWLEKESGIAPGSLTKQHAMEVGSSENPDTARSSTGALGPFQFTRGTAKAMGLYNPLTGEDARTDFIQSADAAARLNVKNAEGLSSFLGRQPTAAELSVAYQQGLGGAKALLGNPNASAADALSKAYNGDVDAAARAIRVNGGDPNAPAKQFTDKLTSAFNSMPSDLTKLAAYNRPSSLENGPLEAGSPADIFRGTPATSSQGGEGFAVPGGQQTAAQAASSSPQNFGDWLSGLFDTSARVKQLESQGRTSTYPGEDASDVKQWYADQFTGGDVNKVQSRIVDFGQGPVVDYYAKDLGTALMEGFTSPFKAVGDMFSGKGIESLPQGSSVRDRKFMDLFSQNVPSRGYGPNGDLTLEEYRQIYGR